MTHKQNNNKSRYPKSKRKMNCINKIELNSFTFDYVRMYVSIGKMMIKILDILCQKKIS